MRCNLLKSGKSIESLYHEKSYIIKHLKTGIYIEFIKFWNWDDDTLLKHPEFRQYSYACIGINMNNVECFGITNNISKTDFYFRYCNRIELEYIRNLSPIFKGLKLDSTDECKLIENVLYSK